MVWIESSVPGTYNLVLGQGDLTITRSAASMDTSSKDDDGYATSAPGLKTVGVSCDIRPKLPDANGYTRLETLSNASPALPFNAQVRKGGKTGGNADVVFQCSVYGNLDETAAPQVGALSVRTTLTAAAAPTVDTLA
jgi:predicted secreted protein